MIAEPKVYINPAATSDIIVENYKREILLIQRGEEPYKDMWALPGGHLNLGQETAEYCAKRELQEETGLIVKLKNLKLVGVYSEPNRDPRGHYITHAYATKYFTGEVQAADDAKNAQWFSLSQLPELAFDHVRIISDYKQLEGGRT
ncbi:MAG: 8-oxo-dGTP diphosphatase [Patescibacteria group bacterium]|jgi:8-oxo-dGTP diphosphatase